MNCTICNGNLKTKSIKNVNVEVCDSCGAIFLHKGELNKITHPTAGDLEYSSLENIDLSKVSDTCCPACINEKMINVHFLSESSIMLKYCIKCNGIMLEKDELDSINQEIDKINKDLGTWRHGFMLFLSNLPFS